MVLWVNSRVFTWEPGVPSLCGAKQDLFSAILPVTGNRNMNLMCVEPITLLSLASFVSCQYSRCGMQCIINTNKLSGHGLTSDFAC